MNRPELSVLLVSWNTREETARCLASMHAEGQGLDYEVIAVDNGSRDGSAELLAADPRVGLICNERNVGFAAAVNQARRAAGGELLLLLNSDVVFRPGALATLVQFLRDRPDASGVSPLYLNPDGTFQQHYVNLPSFAACIALWTVLRRFPGFRGALHRFEMRGDDFSRPRELMSASCVLIRANSVGADAIFDEQFPVYWNDALLARERRAAGLRMWMIPDAVVTHTRGASCRLLGPALRFRHLLGGLVRYLRITEPHWRVELFRLVVTADYLLKTAFGRTTTLGWSDLRAALRGDVGPLPDGDTRDWEVLAGPRAGVAAVDTSVGSGGVRRLIVEPPAEPRARRFAVTQTAPSEWRATLPTTLRIGDASAPIRWLNRRLAAARLRHWLDRQAGARTLTVDESHQFLIGWLGEDMTATVERPEAAA